MEANPVSVALAFRLPVDGGVVRTAAGLIGAWRV